MLFRSGVEAGVGGGVGAGVVGEGPRLGRAVRVGVGGGRQGGIRFRAPGIWKIRLQPLKTWWRPPFRGTSNLTETLDVANIDRESRRLLELKQLPPQTLETMGRGAGASA